MKVHTIGFTQKDARTFLGLLKQSGAKRIVDVRLNNVSQLAGFAKRQDLEFFLKEICGMDYVHLPDSGSSLRGFVASCETSFLSLLRQKFEDLHPAGAGAAHPLRRALEKLSTLQTIRIIEGKS